MSQVTSDSQRYSSAISSKTSSAISSATSSADSSDEDLDTPIGDSAAAPIKERPSKRSFHNSIFIITQTASDDDEEEPVATYNCSECARIKRTQAFRGKPRRSSVVKHWLRVHNIILTSSALKSIQDWIAKRQLVDFHLALGLRLESWDSDLTHMLVSPFSDPRGLTLSSSNMKKWLTKYKR